MYHPQIVAYKSAFLKFEVIALVLEARDFVLICPDGKEDKKTNSIAFSLGSFDNESPKTKGDTTTYDHVTFDYRLVLDEPTEGPPRVVLSMSFLDAHQHGSSVYVVYQAGTTRLISEDDEISHPSELCRELHGLLGLKFGGSQTLNDTQTVDVIRIIVDFFLAKRALFATARATT